MSSTRPRRPFCSAQAHVRGRPAACICMPVGMRIECMAASMALWKLTAAHCATRSCLPSPCAISPATTHLLIGPERSFGDMLNVFGAWQYLYRDAAAGLPQEPAAGCDCGVRKRACEQLAAGSSGAVI